MKRVAQGEVVGRVVAVDVRTVSEHLKNIFASGELDEDSVIRKFRITESDGKLASSHPFYPEQRGKMRFRQSLQGRIDSMANRYVPDYMVTPGQVLDDYLTGFDMTQAELAVGIGLT